MTGGTRDGTGDRRLVPQMVIVPVLMVAVAALGMWRYHADHQTSWRGATAGMFARVDAPANRIAMGIVQPGDDESERFPIPPPPEAREQWHRAIVTPTAANLQELADAWAPRVPDGRLVRVEVLATQFRSGPGGPSVRLERIASFDVNLNLDADGESGRASLEDTDDRPTP